jgi:thiamine biosynthesis lipoprotein
MQSSELSQFNRAAGTRAAITPEFRSVLLAAKHMADASGGLFNPFILPALQRAGYRQSMVPEFTNDEQDDHSAKRLVAATALEIGDGWAGIPYGTAIDLGGCGKGFIGDVLADMADKQDGLSGYWFSIGGDVVTAGCDERGEPWTVYVTPHISDISQQSRLASATAPSTSMDTHFAVATSTVSFRTNHIIDPRDGKPANTNIVLVTTCGDMLLEADVFASCAIILGYPKAVSWLKQHVPQGAFLQIKHDNGDTQPLITTKTIGHSIKKWL